MAYAISSDGRIGAQPINTIDTVQRHLLGTRISGSDPIYGDGEFIYLKGVALTVQGSCVTYDGASSGVPTYQTVLAPATANLGQPLAFAMAACVANNFGWYQIAGSVIAATNGTLAAGPGKVYLAGSGQVTSAALAGGEILSCRNNTATGTPATNQAVLQIDRPSAQGAIT